LKKLELLFTGRSKQEPSLEEAKAKQLSLTGRSMKASWKKQELPREEA
jgi:hypothetical protein